MNCKQGDLAIVVQGTTCMGAIVRCLRFVGTPPEANPRWNQCWEVDRKFMWVRGGLPHAERPYLPDQLPPPHPRQRPYRRNHRTHRQAGKGDNVSLTGQFTLWFLAMSAIYIAPTLPKPFATLMGMAFLLIGGVVLLIGRMT